MKVKQRQPATGIEEIHITFDDSTVTIRSDVEQVQSRIRRDFAQLIGKREGTSVAVLGLNTAQNGFVLEGPAFTPIQHRDLDQLIVVLKEEVRLEFMRSRPDLLWLHAGAVERDGRCMLILGVSGQGKSTLSTSLYARGWRLMSDDVVPIAMDGALAYPFPQTPFRRVPSDDDWNPVQLSTAGREAVELSPESIVIDPVPIGELVFPFFERGAPTVLSRLTKGEGALEMLRSSTNFCDHKEKAVERAARMAETLPAYRLVYGVAEKAVQSLEGLRGS